MAGKDTSIQNQGLIDDSDMENIKLHRAESMVTNDVVIMEKSLDETDKPQKKDVVKFVGSRTRFLCSEINYLKVEVVMFLYMFSYIVRSTTNTVLMMDKVCLVHLGRSDYECANLKDDVDLLNLKKEVEKIANNYHVGHSLISMLPSVVLSLFIGSWSDKYGRKVPIMAALIGIIIDGLGATMCAFNYRSRVEYMYIPAIFSGISGGFVGVLLILYAYASDISNSGNRTLRYALMEMMFGLSMPLGSLAGGWIYKFFGFVPVFLTSTCGHILGLCWVIFMVDETRGLDNKDSWKTKFLAFWSIDSLVHAFKTTIKKRPNRGREQVWALILGMSVSVFAFASTASIGYLYVYHRYNWDNTEFSTVSSIFSVLSIIAMLIVVPLSKKYQVRDVFLGTVGSLSLMAKMICMGLAVNRYLYYLACILGLFSSLGTLIGRSKISKVVPNEDLGKVFAFMTSAESILPIAATAIISQGYNASLDIFPGLVYVVMGALCVIPTFIFLWISRMPNANYDAKAEQVTNYSPNAPNNTQKTEPSEKT